MDYEGEIGVIISKAEFHISEDVAMDYVWGYTTINDVTLSEGQNLRPRDVLASGTVS